MSMKNYTKSLWRVEPATGGGALLVRGHPGPGGHPQPSILIYPPDDAYRMRDCVNALNGTDDPEQFLDTMQRRYAAMEAALKRIRDYGATKMKGDFTPAQIATDALKYLEE